MTPNRIVALVTALLGLVAAVSVPLANLDTTSTAGVIAGVGAVALVAVKWLDGWIAHEERQFYGRNALEPVDVDPEQEGDGGEDPATAGLPVGDYSKLPDDKGDAKAARKHA